MSRRSPSRRRWSCARRRSSASTAATASSPIRSSASGTARSNKVTTGMTVFSPGTGIPLHSHNVEESVLVYEGEATAVVGDDEFDLVAGQATWVPAGVPHCFRNRGEGSMTIYWVYGGRDVTRDHHRHRRDVRAPVRRATAGRPARMSAVVTVNPATGERLAEYPAFSDAEVDAALDRAAAAQTGWAALPYAERAAVLRRDGRGPAGRGRGPRAAGHPRDGQAAGRGPRRGREVRHGVRLLRRARRRLPRRRAGGHLRRPQLDRLRAGRRGARGHAVELPALAGAPLRRPGAHGRQRRAAQALAEHHRLRAGGASGCWPRPGRPRGCSRPSSSPSPTSPRSPGG